MGTSRSRPTVVSIVGPGRSGTTILARILGEMPGVVDAGELRWEWKRGILERRPCGCGATQFECPVWSRVVPRVLGAPSGPAGIEQVEAAARKLVGDQAELAGRRHITRVMRDAASPSDDWPALRRLQQVTTALCAELADLAGADLVIDTSKRPQDAALLASAPGIDHYVVHIVRDPRAVAHSWRRAKPIPSENGPTTMATRSLARSVERWLQNCLEAAALRRHIPPERWHFLRYEDFAAEPQASLDRIASFLGLPVKPLVQPGGTVVLDTTHTVAGNPDRFRTGRIPIVVDDEWRRRMPRREQILVGLATAPLLARYGYPIIPRSARSDDRHRHPSLPAAAN